MSENNLKLQNDLLKQQIKELRAENRKLREQVEEFKFEADIDQAISLVNSRRNANVD